MSARVSEWMSPAVVVPADTSLEDCARALASLDRRHLPVVDADGRLAGLVTDAAVDRELRRSLTDDESARTAADLQVPVDVVARVDDDLGGALRALCGSPQDLVVVVDEREHPVGVMTEHDVLGLVPAFVDPELRVDELPRRVVVAFRASEPAPVALDAMLQHHIRHIPVLDAGGALVGVASYRDLVRADVPRRPVLLGQVCSADVAFADPGDSLVACAARLRERQVSSLPIVVHGRLVRMVTRRDLVQAVCAALEEEGLFESAVAAPPDGAT